MSSCQTNAHAISSPAAPERPGAGLPNGHGVPVRIGSRSADIPFDWQGSTWERALEDVSAACLSYDPDLAMPGAAETVGAFALRALDEGVRRRGATSASARSRSTPSSPRLLSGRCLNLSSR